MPSCLESFFFVPSEQRSAGGGSVVKEPLRILLSGPASCGKTSLLLQFAYNTALEKTSTVIFICNRKQLESDPPVVSQGVDPTSNVFERIHFKYVDDEDELCKYFAAFHLQSILPQAVIIDNFCDLVLDRKYDEKRVQETAVVKILALCCNAIDHANQKLPPTKKCHLVVSDSHAGGTRYLYLLRRWLSVQCNVKPLGRTKFACSTLSDRGIRMSSDEAMYTKLDDFLKFDGLHRSSSSS